MFQSPAIKDEILKSYIEQIFSRYDANSLGTLNPAEMTNFFNDLFRSLNIPLVLTPQQSLDAIKTVYPAYNGAVNREELFNAFKVLLGLSPMPQQQPVNTGFGNYPGMVSNGFVGMPSYVNMASNSSPIQTDMSLSKDTWSIRPSSAPHSRPILQTSCRAIQDILKITMVASSPISVDSD